MKERRSFEKIIRSMRRMILYRPKERVLKVCEVLLKKNKQRGTVEEKGG